LVWRRLRSGSELRFCACQFLPDRGQKRSIYLIFDLIPRNALIVIDPESSVERGSGKSLLPESGLTFGLPLPTCRLEHHVHHFDLSPTPMASFVSLKQSVLARSPNMRIHTSAGSIREIGTRSISSGTSGKFCAASYCIGSVNPVITPNPRSKVKSGDCFQSLVMSRARRDPQTPLPPERTRETRINTGDCVFSVRVVVIRVHSRPAAYFRISLAPPLHP
jgi:hypothetical protein